MAKIRKIQTSVTLPADIMARLHEEAFGDSLSAVIGDRLRQAFAMGPREAAPASPLEAIDLRKKEAEAAMAERKAALLTGRYVLKEEAWAVVARDYATIASRLNNIPSALIGATPEQVDDLKKIVQDCMTDLSCGDPAIWDDLTEEAMKESQ